MKRFCPNPGTCQLLAKVIGSSITRHDYTVQPVEDFAFLEAAMNHKKALAILVWLLLVVNFALPQAVQPAAQNPQPTTAQATQTAKAPRPLEVADVASWKRIQQPTVSNDGQWFAYRL